MSEQLETTFEDILHRLARKFNKRGLSVRAIGEGFAGRAKFVTYLPDHVEYPDVVSDETSARRRGLIP
jgi:hypothetical protein